MSEPAAPQPSSADRELTAVAGRLEERKAALGADYWQDAEVQALQQRLRHLLGTYGAWADDKLPMHQRARRAARWESEVAHLLWPGRDA